MSAPMTAGEGYVSGLGKPALQDEWSRLLSQVPQPAKLSVATLDQLDAATHEAEGNMRKVQRAIHAGLIEGMRAPEATAERGDRLAWFIAFTLRRVPELGICRHLRSPQPTVVPLAFGCLLCADCACKAALELHDVPICEACLQPSQWFHPFVAQIALFVFMGEICPTCFAFACPAPARA